MAAKPSVGSEPLAPPADDRELVATRTFAAPRALVWTVLTEPEHIAEWWGPEGFTSTIASMDVRPGGRWRFVMHGPDGTDHPNEIVYVEVVAPERLVFDHVVEPHFRTTLTLTEAGGRTTVEMRMRFATAAERDATVRIAGADEGLRQNLAKLDRYLEGPVMHAAARGRPEMVVSRVVAAPRALVWAAFTEPEHLKQWWAPRVLTTPEAEVDLRVGGRYRVVMADPTGQRYPFHGLYLEIVEGERLVFTNLIDGLGGDENRMITTVRLEDAPGGTRVTVHQTRPAAEGPAKGQAQGWTETLEKLAEHLEG